MDMGLHPHLQLGSGVSFMCLSFVTVGMVHLVLVLHLTMVRGVGGFPRLTILFRWFMPACLLASTFVYFVQSMHTTRYQPFVLVPSYLLPVYLILINFCCMFRKSVMAYGGASG